VTLSRPALLADSHDLENFACGEESLDDWLRRRARPNQVSGASRTYVLCDDNRVAGYYALASGAVATSVVPGRFRRNMPDPVPVVILARLAVDRAWQRRGIGRGLFRDAALRVAQAADTIGVRGILVHTISEEARNFYLSLGFDECPGQPMMLVVTLADLRAALS
jgi:GNAT superfamily N-acetyltransferase